MIVRSRHTSRIRQLLDEFAVVGLLGARQVGKTTLARALVGEPVHWFDLEDPVHLAALADPSLALRSLTGTIVIDEVQRKPDLFPLLRVLADRPGKPARFVVLGSAAPDLLRQSSETLAGRIAYHLLGGFTLDEVGGEAAESLWLRGRFPDAFLAASDEASFRWREQFVRTFIERDAALLGLPLPPATMRRFWSMLAHWHGQEWNASEFARAFGVSHTTVRSYLEALEGTFLVRQLRPWHENISKRQVKAPRIHLSDSGLLHALLGLRDRTDVLGHPRAGASFEGFAIEEILTALGTPPEGAFYWRTHAGAELDLLVVHGRRRVGFEIKLTDAPRRTRSMTSAAETLSLDELVVVHAGTASYPIGENMRAVPISRVWSELGPL